MFEGFFPRFIKEIPLKKMCWHQILLNRPPKKCVGKNSLQFEMKNSPENIFFLFCNVIFSQMLGLYGPFTCAVMSAEDLLLDRVRLG